MILNIGLRFQSVPRYGEAWTKMMIGEGRKFGLPEMERYKEQKKKTIYIQIYISK